jgi:hypothetical protein
VIEILRLKIENLQLRIALAHTNRALADANIEMLTPQLKGLQSDLALQKAVTMENKNAE